MAQASAAAVDHDADLPHLVNTHLTRCWLVKHLLHHLDLSIMVACSQRAHLPWHTHKILDHSLTRPEESLEGRSTTMHSYHEYRTVATRDCVLQVLTQVTYQKSHWSMLLCSCTANSGRMVCNRASIMRKDVNMWTHMTYSCGSAVKLQSWAW